VTRTPFTRSKVKGQGHQIGRFCSPPCWRIRRLCGGRENVLAVWNCCYAAVCSAAESVSAPTEGGEGRGHTVAAARLQLVIVIITINTAWLFASVAVLVEKNWRGCYLPRWLRWLRQCAPVRNGLSEELGSIPGQAVDFEFEFHGQMLWDKIGKARGFVGVFYNLWFDVISVIFGERSKVKVTWLENGWLWDSECLLSSYDNISSSDPFVSIVLHRPSSVALKIKFRMSASTIHMLSTLQWLYNSSFWVNKVTLAVRKSTADQC